jgi:opacity protein-like surface antigen
MKKSLLFSAALAVACLAGLSASVNAQPVEPAPAFRMSTAAADTRAQSVQTVSATHGEGLGAVYLVTDAASHKPAHGGYPGVVGTQVLRSPAGYGAVVVPLRPQPGYRT